jgi:hypothetical protein
MGLVMRPPPGTTGFGVRVPRRAHLRKSSKFSDELEIFWDRLAYLLTRFAPRNSHYSALLCTSE